jgi:hypothetical protein
MLISSLVSAFCRTSSEHGGSGMFVENGLETKEISYFAGISEEKIFETLLIELPGYKLYVVRVCRSPDGQFDKFLNKLVIYSEITNER